MRFAQTVLAVAVLTCLHVAYADDVVDQPQQESEPATLEDALSGVLGANPKEIVNARKKIARFQAAQRAPLVDTYEDFTEQPMAIDETFIISSKPDSRAPSVNIAKYQSTGLNFVDAYGKPWPVRKFFSALDGVVKVSQVADPETTSAPTPVNAAGVPQQDAGAAKGGSAINPNDPQAGSLNITGLKPGAAGNITVYLLGRSRPVSIDLVSMSGVYHSDATVKLMEVGPQTDLHNVNRGDEIVVGAKADEDLNNALYGIGPQNSKEMVVEGGEAKAWLKGNFLYLQTPLSIFSPRVLGATHANGPYKAYKVPSSTMVMASNDEGKTISLHIKRSIASEIYSEATSGSGR